MVWLYYAVRVVDGRVGVGMGMVVVRRVEAIDGRLRWWVWCMRVCWVWCAC